MKDVKGYGIYIGNKIILEYIDGDSDTSLHYIGLLLKCYFEHTFHQYALFKLLPSNIKYSLTQYEYSFKTDYETSSFYLLPKRIKQDKLKSIDIVGKSDNPDECIFHHINGKEEDSVRIGIGNIEIPATVGFTKNYKEEDCGKIIFYIDNKKYPIKWTDYIMDINTHEKPNTPGLLFFTSSYCVNGEKWDDLMEFLKDKFAGL